MHRRKLCVITSCINIFLISASIRRSNTRCAYFTWYVLGKKNSATDWERVNGSKIHFRYSFHKGSVRPNTVAAVYGLYSDSRHTHNTQANETIDPTPYLGLLAKPIVKHIVNTMKNNNILISLLNINVFTLVFIL